MPKKIILVRHGETDDNKARRFQGWQDTPLNLTGHAQAEKAAHRLAHEKVDAIYTSDLLRAYQTAEHIASVLSLPLMRRHQLREKNMGVFEGWRWEVEKDPMRESLWQEYEKSRDDGNMHWDKHEGESLLTHFERVDKFMGKVKQIHVDQVIILVTHGGTLNRIYEHFNFKMTNSQYISYNNTSISVVEKINNTRVLTLDNDTSHLN
jgi:broad specificity phosphatase PhoE